MIQGLAFSLGEGVIIGLCVIMLVTLFVKK